MITVNKHHVKQLYLQVISYKNALTNMNNENCLSEEGKKILKELSELLNDIDEYNK